MLPAHISEHDSIPLTSKVCTVPILVLSLLEIKNKMEVPAIAYFIIPKQFQRNQFEIYSWVGTRTDRYDVISLAVK
jgi:hypothetical protein